MRLLKVAFALLIALDLLVILLAVFIVKPLWILLSIIGCAVLKGLHNHFQVRHKLGQYYKLRKKSRVNG